MDEGEDGDMMFNESDRKYTSRDIRFTVKGDVIYAIVLDWPGEEAVIRTLVHPEEEDEEEEDNEDDEEEDDEEMENDDEQEDDEEEEEDYWPGYYLYPDEIKTITMLGDGDELEWEVVRGEGLVIKTPKAKPCEHAFVFKITRQ